MNSASGLERVTSKYEPTTNRSCLRYDRSTGTAGFTGEEITVLKDMLQRLTAKRQRALTPRTADCRGPVRCSRPKCAECPAQDAPADRNNVRDYRFVKT
jgi:hypothetical protein